jgi:hypothetical protein
VNIDSEEDNDRSDKMSVYSRRVIENVMKKKDNDTDSKKTINTENLSVYAVMMNNKNISVPNTPSPIVVVKTGKVTISRFYDDSYYMALRNKVNYYPEDNCSIFVYGFNDYLYEFFV